MIHKLVGPKQNGFILGHGTFDTIIVVQEIACSLESDFPAPRIILKIDIEKVLILQNG